MHAPQRIDTPRLILRRPEARDASAIFARYAADPDVTRYLGWPRHLTEGDTLGFIEFSDEAWHTTPCGPYLIESRSTHALLGSAGFAFEAEAAASVGYVLAKDAWGRGYATEALCSLATLAREIGLARLNGYCHPDNTATHRVLEKCGFHLDTARTLRMAFPNLDERGTQEIVCYVKVLAGSQRNPREAVGRDVTA